MAIDSTYYGNYLKNLYEKSTTGSKPLYNTNPILFGLVKNDDTYFNSYVASSIFKKKVVDAIFGSQKQRATTEYSRQDNTENFNAEYKKMFPIEKSSAIEFSDTIDTEVNIDFVREGVINGTELLYILNDVFKYNEGKPLDINESSENLKIIIKSVCKYVTKKNGFTSLYKPANIQSFRVDSDRAKLPLSNYNSSIVKATASLTFMAADSLDRLYEEIIKKLEKILKDPSTPIPNELVFKNFNPTQADGFKTPFYFYIRSKLIEQISMSDGVFQSDSSQVMYAKRIAVETVLKTSYPLVQYLLLDGIINTYAEVGDFVNVRIGYIAKLIFVYKFINNIADIGIQSKANEIYKYINDLIQTVNSSTEIPLIAKDLHKLSKKAVETSQSLEQIKQDIANSQISLGNIVNNVESIKAKFNAKKTEFWVIFSLIFVYVLVAGLLIFLKMPVFVYFIIATVISIILVYLAIKVIKMIISKN